MAKLKCICSHPEQDRLHGRNVRVMNPTSKKTNMNKRIYRCTVCGKERTK